MIPLLNRTPFRLNIADSIILSLAVLLIVWLYYSLWFKQTSGRAETLIVQMEQQKPIEYPLNQDRLLELNGRIGKSLLEIKQGKVRFVHSVCRNQFCVFHGWLSTPGDTTACLPNRISISLKGYSTQFDALAGER